MTRLEQIEFETEEKFMEAIKKLLKGEEAFRTIAGANNEPKKLKIISKNNLYLGNNLSLCIKKAENGKIYVSINYFSIENRFEMHKNKNKEV